MAGFFHCFGACKKKDGGEGSVPPHAVCCCFGGCHACGGRKPELREFAEIPGARRFTFRELARATNSFQEEYKIGEGGFASVYRGELGGQMVAIKKLKARLVDEQVEKDFVNELELLAKMDHPNIIKLIGYCAEGDQGLMVLEYLARGSLEDNLHRQNEQGVNQFSWSRRMQIAADVGNALQYLHLDKNIIFRDLKSANILLDNEFNAKLCDFGTAREGPIGEEEFVITRVLGTFGYLPPEYAQTGHLSFRTDMWCFSILVLELVTGRKVIDSTRGPMGRCLVIWARRMFHDRVDNQTELAMVDPHLNDQFLEIDLRQALGMCERCILDLYEVFAEDMTWLANGFAYLAFRAAGGMHEEETPSLAAGRLIAEGAALGNNIAGGH